MFFQEHYKEMVILTLNRQIYDNLTLGLELEMSGQSRRRAAEVIADFFGTSYVYEGPGGYDKYIITDSEGRKWTVMSDASIVPLQKNRAGTVISAPDTHKVEFVSPPLLAKDIEMYQEIVRKLRKAGFFESSSCGIHIHVGIKDLPPTTIIHILNQVHSKQDLIYKALGVPTAYNSRYRYCQRIPTNLVETLKKKKAKTLSQIADVWYSTIGNSGERYIRYPHSRYYIVNMTRGLVPDSRFYYGTVEFRCFCSTLHAGKIKAYMQFCLLLVSYCATLTKSSYKPVVINEGDSEAYKFRVRLVKMSCCGDEFKTMRIHLLDRFGTQSKAWRRGDRTSR